MTSSRQAAGRVRAPSFWASAFALLACACGSSGTDGPTGASGAGHGGGGGSLVSSGAAAGQASGGALTSGSAGALAGGGAQGGGSSGSGAGDQGLGGQTSAGASSGGHAGAAPGDGILQIMPLGDSITVGSSGTNAGYRGPLFNLLRSSVQNLLFVGSSRSGAPTTNTDALPEDQRSNEGHSSYTINDINANLDGLDTATFEQYGGADRDPNGGHWLDGIASGPGARSAVYPDIITLMIGTNNASDQDRAAVQMQLHALLTKITTLRPETRLLVAQITPSNRPNNVSYNAAVASEVASFQAAGKHVTLVDMSTNFPADGLSTDQVHPNDSGFAFMAQQWLDAITQVSSGIQP